MTSILLRTAIGAFVLLALGCATPYKSYGSLGGYSDKDLGDGRYWVKFVGNGFTSPDQVRKHWNRRASELCGGRDFDADASNGIESHEQISTFGTVAYPETVRFPKVEGTIRCARP